MDLPTDPIEIRDELRAFLNSDPISLAEVERATNLNRSWLSKFRRNEIVNPTVEQLAKLHQYRLAYRQGQSAA